MDRLCLMMTVVSTQVIIMRAQRWTRITKAWLLSNITTGSHALPFFVGIGDIPCIREVEGPVKF